MLPGGLPSTSQGLELLLEQLFPIAMPLMVSQASIDHSNTNALLL
jgi:hypothetical protein